MTEQELQAIEKRIDHGDYDDMPDVIAEVRRLQGLIEYVESHRFDGCPWCNPSDGVKHEPTCPAFGSEA